MLTVFFICFLIFFFSSSSSSSSSFFLFLFLFSGTSRYRGSFCMPLRPFQPTIRKYMNLFILTFLHILICAPVSICVYICICVGVCVCVCINLCHLQSNLTTMIIHDTLTSPALCFFVTSFSGNEKPGHYYLQKL